MTLQRIRAYIESSVNAAYAGLADPVTVVFENTLDTPPALPYVLCLIDYTSTTELLVCNLEPATEDLRGNLQLSCFVKRGRGMRQLEELASTAMATINNLYDWESEIRVKPGAINGPVSDASGVSGRVEDAYVFATVSCPFQARDTA